MSERLQVVDENDRPIGSASREQAWEQALILRHSHVVLRDEAGRFLLQQRSQTRKASPNRWSMAAAGHVDAGETYRQAAEREMLEEIGITTPLEYIGKFRSTHPHALGTVDAFIGVFSGTITSATPTVINPEEVQATKWYTRQEVLDLITTRPDDCTVNLPRIFERYFAES